MIPTWLAHHLEETAGAPVGARYAKPRYCRCGRLTVVGLDADVLAFTVRVDPTPLTPAGELAAAITGRPTYELASLVGRLVLDRREPDHLTGRPPFPGATYDVLPAHDCAAPDYTGRLVASSNLTHLEPALLELDVIPF